VWFDPRPITDETQGFGTTPVRQFARTSFTRPGGVGRGRQMTGITRRSANDLSIVTTLVDALLAFRRGQHKSGLLLLGAAALSKRVNGLGTATSVLLRLVRKFR
jgi:hypothetical protein